MSSPLRVVCEGCLRSIELDSVSSPDGRVACPFCGCRVDSRTSDGGPSEADTEVPRHPGDSPSPDDPETIDWTTAWTRGSLGSLGRFHLRERLGDGGFGQVYLAYDPRLDRDVAVKVLRQPNPSDRVMERFFREARAVARLDHPNIVSVHDAGYDEGRCWVAYQLVGGRPLWWYRDRQRMDPTTAARIVRDLADALNHAHSMGVVHRDIKPGNVIIDDRGRPRLIDFGLARRKDIESDLTRDGVVVGTPAYMSPEQAGGKSKQADERSDVYSLGVIFYELLCGRRPNEARMAGADGEGEPGDRATGVPAARSLNAAVPPALDAICARAMSPRPEDRYPSARALADAIDRWLNRRPSFDPRPLLGGVAAVLLVVTGIVAAFIPGQAGKNRPRAASLISPTAPVESKERASVPGHSEKAPVTAAGAAQLVGNLKSKKYHLPGCTSVPGISGSNRILLESPEEAYRLGLEECERCKPPRPRRDQAPHIENEAAGGAPTPNG